MDRHFRFGMWACRLGLAYWGLALETTSGPGMWWVWCVLHWHVSLWYIAMVYGAGLWRRWYTALVVVATTLFHIYLDDLLRELWTKQLGYHIKGYWLGAFGYADNLILSFQPTPFHLNRNQMYVLLRKTE